MPFHGKGGSGVGTQPQIITQAGHGFAAGARGPLSRTAAGNYIAARATTTALAEVWAWLVEVVDANRLRIVTVSGIEVDLPATDGDGLAFVDGDGYFVSALAPPAGAAGLLTATAPTVIGLVVKPCILTTSATTGLFEMFLGRVVSDTAHYDLYGLSQDPSIVDLGDWENIADNPSIWGGAPPANVVDTTPLRVGQEQNSKAIWIPGASQVAVPQIMGLGQAQDAGPFVASIELSVAKRNIHNAAQTAGCSAGFLWVDANGQNMRGCGFDIGGNRGIANTDTNAFSRIATWNASADANNDPTDVWTIGGGATVGYGDFRGKFTMERDGANDLFMWVETPRIGAPTMINSAGIASAGGAGFLVACMFIPTNAAFLFDLYTHSQLLVGTVLPWRIPG